MSPQSMSPDELRVAVAELCGWVEQKDTGYSERIWSLREEEAFGLRELPNFPGDLNAAREACVALLDTPEKRRLFIGNLCALEQYGSDVHEAYGERWHKRDWSSSEMETVALAEATPVSRALLMTLGHGKEGV